MSNFITQYTAGKLGKNVGLPTGLDILDVAINGLQRRTIIGVAAPPKVGKSKFTNAHFILYPYLLSPNIDIEWIYYSYEMDRVQVEFAFAVFFLMYDYDMTIYKHNNKTEFITTDYLMGRLKDRNTHKPIIVSEEIEVKLKLIYRNRIIPLFGEHDNTGKRISKGKIDFIEDKQTANEMANYVMNHAKQKGKFITESFQTIDKDGKTINQNRLKSYEANNPDSYTIIITDTLRKIKLTTGENKKQAADSWIESSVRLRNLTNYSFVHIIHCNRNLTNTDRMTISKEFLHPTGDDIKETGNLSEEADYILTLFNPNDEKYALRKHFGLDLFDNANNLLYPDYRSLHLVESRHTICPQHLQLELNGATGYYKQLGT